MLLFDNKLQRLIADMADVTGHLNTDEFEHVLLQMLVNYASFDNMTVVGFPSNARPHLIYGETKKDVYFQDGDLARYVDGAYLLDPFYLAIQENKPTDFYCLKDIASDNFYESAYFRQYYQFSNLKDEVGYLFALKSGAYLHLSLASTIDYQPEELAALKSFTPWLEVMLHKQWSNLLDQEQGRSEEVTMHNQLSVAFKNFGRSLLTDRECEVARLILQGHSTKSMAVKLKLSIETIKVHRRNLYPKLDISSQPELFSLFLESLALVATAEEKDPLIAYHSKSSKP